MDIEEAGQKDRDEIFRLIRELGRATGQTPEVDTDVWWGTLDRMLTSTEWSFLLASDGGNNIGLLVMVILPTLYHGANYATITELIVSEDRRGRGVGRRLVERAKSIARDRGCKEIHVSTEFDNKAAIAFYERVGFNKEHAFLELEL